MTNCNLVYICLIPSCGGVPCLWSYAPSWKHVLKCLVQRGYVSCLTSKPKEKSSFLSAPAVSRLSSGKPRGGPLVLILFWFTSVRLVEAATSLIHLFTSASNFQVSSLEKPMRVPYVWHFIPHYEVRLCLWIFWIHTHQTGCLQKPMRVSYVWPCRFVSHSMNPGYV